MTDLHIRALRRRLATLKRRSVKHPGPEGRWDRTEAAALEAALRELSAAPRDSGDGTGEG